MINIYPKYHFFRKFQTWSIFKKNSSSLVSYYLLSHYSVQLFQIIINKTFTKVLKYEEKKLILHHLYYFENHRFQLYFENFSRLFTINSFVGFFSMRRESHTGFAIRLLFIHMRGVLWRPRFPESLRFTTLWVIKVAAIRDVPTEMSNEFQPADDTGTSQAKGSSTTMTATLIQWNFL